MAETRNKNIVKAISNALVLGEIDTTGNIAGGDLDADTTPQLGGNLDINGNDIISLAGANIDILPHTSGKINLDGDGSTSGVSVTDGLIEMRTSTGSVAAIDMYCEVSNAHKVTIKPPPHADYSGNVTFQLPSSNGTSGYLLQTDGNGVTSWAAAGVTGFDSADNTSSPNNTINAASLTVNSSSTDADFVIEPKGAGAILSHIPGGDAATGNKRGAFAIDLQLNRTDGTPAAGNVPSAYGATIIAGYDNKIAASGSGTDNSNSATVSRGAIIASTGSTVTSASSGTQYQIKEAIIIGSKDSSLTSTGATSYQSIIAGGSVHTINGHDRGGIFSGRQNTLGNGDYSTIVGGYLHNVNGSYNNATAGYDHQIDSTAIYSSINAGYFNEIEGDYTFIGGGYSHFIDDGCQYGAIVGGYNHTLDGDYAGMFAGRDNAMTSTNSQYSVILGGYALSIAGNYSAILSGVLSEVTGNQAAIVGGYDNHVSDHYSVVIGGRDNDIDGQGSVALGGHHGYDHGKNASVIMPAGIFDNSWDDGEAQQKYNTVAHETTDATQTALNTHAGDLTVGSSYFAGSLNSNGASLFKITLIANVTGGGDTKAWTFEGVFKKGSLASSVAFVGTPVKNVIASDTGASSWDADVQVNTTYGGVEVACTGAASTTIRWVAQISQTQVAF